jgi:hypothetical protein
VTGRLAEIRRLPAPSDARSSKRRTEGLSPPNPRFGMRYPIAETSSFLLPRGGGSVPYIDRHLSFNSLTLRSNRAEISRDNSPSA